MRKMKKKKNKCGGEVCEKFDELEIAVDNRQSDPRPEPRLLRQAALEALTNSTRTDSLLE
ncbi:hypothetical protein F511_38809 [Dorcoceras hygrometricum]|uniref:Uncharacterized protein n=1 Tax=Dorcoceras hygrometricum TaxID=472368 RepID=A0A2Z7AG73_9LAMI|nr:hypothetical protein F511_38809 [Dorcoceras hygrometricum]